MLTGALGGTQDQPYRRLNDLVFAGLAESSIVFHGDWKLPPGAEEVRVAVHPISTMPAAMTLPTAPNTHENRSKTIRKRDENP